MIFMEDVADFVKQVWPFALLWIVSVTAAYELVFWFVSVVGV